MSYINILVGWLINTELGCCFIVGYNIYSAGAFWYSKIHKRENKVLFYNK